MATLRLFAGLKDSAGSGSVEIDGDTVGDVIRQAKARFGPAFGTAAERARVWLNGEEAAADDRVGPDDEVALLPPVSGGAQALSVQQISMAGLVGVAALLGMVFADVFGSEAAVAAVAVGIVSIWVIDIAGVMAARGRDLSVVPILVTMVAAVVAARLMGTAGIAVTVVAAVIASLGWGVVSETSRLIQIVAPSSLVSLLAGLSVSSILLVEFGAGGAYPEQATSVYIVIVAVATIAGIGFERIRNLPFGDPFTIVALAAVAASVIAGAVWDLPLDAFLLIGVVMALGLVGGRAFGMVIRTGRTSLVDQPPGATWPLDGAILAAAVYQPLLAMLT